MWKAAGVSGAGAESGVGAVRFFAVMALALTRGAAASLSTLDIVPTDRATVKPGPRNKGAGRPSHSQGTARWFERVAGSARDLGGGALGQEAALLEVVEDRLGRLLDRLLAGVHGHLGIERVLVRVADARELLDDAGAGLLVETLGVALLDHFERRLDVHLDERGAGLLAHFVADVAVGRDRGRDRDHAIAREHVGDETDAADVGVAVFLRKAQALREVLAHFVAVEDFDLLAAVAEDRSEVFGQRALARARETGEPESETFVGHDVWLCD